MKPIPSSRPRRQLAAQGREAAFICPAALGVALLAAALAGCAQNAPQFEQHFGDSVRIAVARQTIRPDAAANRDPVAGVDGAAARNAQDAYRKSFTAAAPPADVFTIGVSGGK
ncbi:MAG TPA: hypothetical protein VGP06_11975 [Janthinobacterium sp.]|jgi:hypothetical protein|nr:hypothetical protein [Janthinobacterium sp.]